MLKYHLQLKYTSSYYWGSLISHLLIYTANPSIDVMGEARIWLSSAILEG